MRKKFKVYVDDLRIAPKGWVLARTITSAIRLLHDFKVDVVSLDHDIVHIDSRGVFTGKHQDECFITVARYIVNMPKLYRPNTVIIHTANPIGAKSLESVLKGKIKNLKINRAFQSVWGDKCKRISPSFYAMGQRDR